MPSLAPPIPPDLPVASQAIANPAITLVTPTEAATQPTAAVALEAAPVTPPLPQIVTPSMAAALPESAPSIATIAIQPSMSKPQIQTSSAPVALGAPTEKSTPTSSVTPSVNDAAAIPATPAVSATREEVQLAPTLMTPADQPSIASPVVDVEAPNADESTSQQQEPPSPDSDTSLLQNADAADTPAADQFARRNDQSTAPDATPQGSDDAMVGQQKGIQKGSVANGSQPSPTSDQSTGLAPGKGHKPARGTGQDVVAQPGAAQGQKQGALGSYVQVQPHGNTEIMNHDKAGITYKLTRFDQDWTPKGESSVDTALRHAVEKASIRHVFHPLPGIRVDCAVNPLLPIALLTCHNPDPPAKPMAQKLYDRLNLPGPALAPSGPATSSTIRVVLITPITLDNSVECATARVAGGPPPPGCMSTAHAKSASTTVPSSSSSWIPASDQFH